MGSPSESRVCHRHEREAGWRAEDLIGGSRQHVLFHGEPTWIRKKNTHMQNIAEHSIAILQVRIAEAQGWNPTRANYMNRATRVCKMVAAHLKASKLTSMNSDFLSCTQLEIIAQSYPRVIKHNLTWLSGKLQAILRWFVNLQCQKLVRDLGISQILERWSPLMFTSQVFHFATTIPCTICVFNIPIQKRKTWTSSCLKGNHHTSSFVWTIFHSYV